MFGQTYIHTLLHTDTHTGTTTVTLAAHARRGLIKSTEVQTLGAIRYNYSINVLSKCSNIISHRSSIFQRRHIDHRSSKVDTSISEDRRIDIRKSTHRSSKIEGGNIAPTFRQFVTEYCLQRCSIVLYLKIPYGIISDEVTHAQRHTATATPRMTPRAPVMYYTPIYIAYMR